MHRPKLLPLLLAASLSAAAGACATGPAPRGAAADPTALPALNEVSPASTADAIQVLRFDEAVRVYGEPAVVSEEDTLLEAQWDTRVGKTQCHHRLRFNRKTMVLLQWSFDCE